MSVSVFSGISVLRVNMWNVSIGIVLICFGWLMDLSAREPNKPESQHLANETVEYFRGTLPLIIAAPHGGMLRPESIPDRKDGVQLRDLGSDSLAVEIGEAMATRYGAWPHVVICHLHRSKVDCNREVEEATEGNVQAVETWNAFHEVIATARKAAGRGLFIDLHGHGHPIDRIEIGYLLSRGQLQMSGASFEGLAPLTSLASLVGKDGRTLEQLVRGPESLGALLEAKGYAVVPSATEPEPGENPFFSGGYNTEIYSKGGPEFFSLQIECSRAGVRDTKENRQKFAAALAEVLGDWFQKNTGIELRAMTE